MTRAMDRRELRDALRLDLDPNEGSGMLRVEHDRLCAARGWDLAFWVCLDDVAVDQCVALLGHRWADHLDGRWEVDRLEPTVVGDEGDTEDAEAMARWDGHVYVFGSHFGSKDGPLQPKRAFVARFREDPVTWNDDGDPEVELVLRRDDLALHRLVNDALAAADVEVIAPVPTVREAFVDKTRDEHDGEPWLADLHDDDRPINIEGAAFRPDGSLVLGLRYPTAADGRPLLVQVDGLQAWFDDPDAPLEVTAVWVLDAIGRDGDIAGVRDLTALGSELHVVTGNIDSRDKGSVVLQDHPDGARTVATHWRCVLGWGDGDGASGLGGGEVAAQPLVEFPDMPRIEGIAADPEGRFYYVSDEDEEVFVRYTRFLTPD
jgi:hypothetical protein